MLANASEWPILIVCYTNHALDQFLEGIKRFCSDNELIRIGGKSQCEALQQFNLSSIKSAMKLNREVPKFIYYGRIESNHRLKSIQEQISNLEKDIEHLTDSVLGYELERVITNCNQQHYIQLRMLAVGRSFNEGILNWLGYGVNMEFGQNENNENGTGGVNDNDVELVQEVYEEPEMDEEEVKELERLRYVDMSSDEEDEVGYDAREKVREPINFKNIVQLDQEDEDGFKLVSSKRKSIKQQIKREIKKSETMTREQAAAVADINALLPNNRWNLYRLWIKLYVEEFENKIKVFRDAYRTECLRFNGLRKREDLEIVRKAKVIGMTTTGAAKYRHIIDGTKPKITSRFSKRQPIKIKLQQCLFSVFSRRRSGGSA